MNYEPVIIIRLPNKYYHVRGLPLKGKTETERSSIYFVSSPQSPLSGDVDSERAESNARRLVVQEVLGNPTLAQGGRRP